MAMKGYSAFPKAPALLEPHYKIVFCHIHETRWGVVPLCRGAFGIFYRPSRLGKDISGFKPRFLDDHCHHQPTGVGSRPATCTNLSEQRSLKLLNFTRNWSLANVWWVASRSASASRRVWNAHHSVLAMGGTLRTELAIWDEDSELFQTIHWYCKTMKLSAYSI